MDTVYQAVSELDSRSRQAYGMLRTNIKFYGEDIKSIVFTSTLAKDGKSEVSYHVAKGFADAGKKVVYIDANIRNQSFNKRFGIDQEVYGLCDYLREERIISDIVYKSGISQLYLIYAGKDLGDATELLEKDLFKELLKTLSGVCDYIIIDCASMDKNIDAVIIAKECNASVIVMEPGKTSYKKAQKMIEHLEKSNCKILGCVFNKVEVKKKIITWKNILNWTNLNY